MKRARGVLCAMCLTLALCVPVFADRAEVEPTPVPVQTTVPMTRPAATSEQTQDGDQRVRALIIGVLGASAAALSGWKLATGKKRKQAPK